MTEDLTSWLDKQADRSLSRQRAQVDTAKLLVTFGTAVAATLEATALQVGLAPSLLDKVGAVLLGVSFLIAVGTVLLDRISEPDTDQLFKESARAQWDTARLLSELQAKALEAELANHEVVTAVRAWALAQLAASGATGVVATVSLLQ